jgi:hypothetical protein
MTWLAFLLSAFCVLIGCLAVGNLVIGLVVTYGFMRGFRCTNQDDLSVALGMLFFGAPLCTALCVLCWWAGRGLGG